MLPELASLGHHRGSCGVNQQKKPYRGIVKYQVIMLVYGLSSLVEK